MTPRPGPTNGTHRHRRPATRTRHHEDTPPEATANEGAADSLRPRSALRRRWSIVDNRLISRYPEEFSMTESTAGLTIVIGSYLEPDQVARIAAAPPVARVAYEPELLPVPRYRCDHNGRRRDLSEGDLARWRSIAASGDVFFDFDWLDPAGMADLAKNGRLRWVQATSAGIGGVHAADRARPQRPDRHHRGRHPRGAAGRVRGHGRAALRQGRARPAAAPAGQELGAVHDQAAGGPAGARGRPRRRRPPGGRQLRRARRGGVGPRPRRQDLRRRRPEPRSSPGPTSTRRCRRSTSSCSPAR